MKVVCTAWGALGEDLPSEGGKASSFDSILSELYTGWQEMLAEHRQIIVEVQEIAAETGWRGPGWR